MNATDQLAETDRWLRYAEEDLTTAEILLRQPHERQPLQHRKTS